MRTVELPKTAVPIRGSVQHWIDIDGSVYAINKRNRSKRNLIKKAQTTIHGYKYCAITYNVDGKNKNISKRVHRLVAEAFIPNPENKPVVCHRNNIKSDNRVDNLYWGTVSENTQQAVNDGLIVNAKGAEDSQSYQVKMFDTQTNKQIGVFGSAKEAERKTGVCISTIMRQCRYHRPVRKEVYFRFLDDDDCSKPVFGAFDLKTDRLLNTYLNIKCASKDMGVNPKTIGADLLRDSKPKWVKNRDVYFKLI